MASGKKKNVACDDHFQEMLNINLDLRQICILSTNGKILFSNTSYMVSTPYPGLNPYFITSKLIGV